MQSLSLSAHSLASGRDSQSLKTTTIFSEWKATSVRATHTLERGLTLARGQGHFLGEETTLEMRRRCRCWCGGRCDRGRGKQCGRGREQSEREGLEGEAAAAEPVERSEVPRTERRQGRPLGPYNSDVLRSAQ